MNDKARILYYYGSQQFDTGSPKALAGFIDTLDRSRFEPLFWAKGQGPLVDALVSHSVKIVIREANQISLRHPARSLQQIRRMISHLRQVDPDLLHITGFEWNLDLVLAAWALRVPIILHVHTPETAHFRNLHRFAATKVLFCSEFQRRNFHHLERIAGKTEVLYNPVNVGRFADAKPVRLKFGIDETAVVITTVAQISKRKGIDIILETARLLLAGRSNLVFLIVGPDGLGEEGYAAEMRRQAVEDPALRGRVRFLGSRQDIPELLASSNLFLLPTLAEPFGIAVVEAMAARLPVVVSHVGGIPEIVTSSAVGHTVPEGTPTAFACAITEILDQPDMGQSIGAKALESVRARFDTAVIGQKLGSIYEDILSAREGK